MTTTEALKMARDALAGLISACKQAKVDLTVGIRDGDPVHPVSAALTWPLATAINTIAAIDALQSTHPADASKSGAQINMAPASLHAAALAMVAAMDQLDAGTDGPWWEDWCNGNGDLCDLIGPAIAGLRAAVSGFSTPDAVLWISRHRNDAPGARPTVHYSAEDAAQHAAQYLPGVVQTVALVERHSAPASKINVLLPDGDGRTVKVLFVERLADGAVNVCIKVEPDKQHSAPSGEPAADLRERLTDAIAAGLHGTYHCTRVWSAWQVGTMDENDFEPVDESDTPGELADAVLALIGTAPAAQAPQAATASVEGLANHVPAGTEAEAATNAKLGMVLLPPIRVDRATHAALQQAAKARGVILPAIVRERLAPYTIPTELLAQIPQRRGEIMGGGPQVMTQAEGALASRVAELCDEVRELKRLLAPSNAVILTGALTGAEVVEHFRRLQPTHDGDGYTMRVE